MEGYGINIAKIIPQKIRDKAIITDTSLTFLFLLMLIHLDERVFVLPNMDTLW